MRPTVTRKIRHRAGNTTWRSMRNERLKFSPGLRTVPSITSPTSNPRCCNRIRVDATPDTLAFDRPQCMFRTGKLKGGRMATTEELAATVEGQTVPGEFVKTARRRADKTALRRKTPDGRWAEVTWQEYADRAARVAGGLANLGVQRGERVVLMLRNRPDFHVIDIGVLLAGAGAVPALQATSSRSD